MKDELIERQEYERDKQIAKYLGITIEEYQEAGGRLEEDTGHEDVLYGYTIYFSDEASPEILNKINFLDKSNNTVALDLNFFQDESEE